VQYREGEAVITKEDLSLLVRDNANRTVTLELVCRITVDKYVMHRHLIEAQVEADKHDLHRRLWDKIYGGELLVRFNRVADFVRRDIALRQVYADYTINPIIQDVDTILALLTTPLPAADDALARACVLAEQTNPQPKEHKP